MKKKDQRQSLKTLTFHNNPKDRIHDLLWIYFNDAPLARASLMFPTK
jgi:hypothetical protein